MLNIAAIDDNKFFLSELAALVSQTAEFDYTIESFTSKEEFFEAIEKKHSYHIIIIDIMLDNCNGIELAKRISAVCTSAEIIFISSDKDFVMDVYSVPHTYFLVKPIDKMHLKRALEMCASSSKTNSITISYRGRVYIIPIDEASYIEGYGKSSVIHYFNGGVHKVSVPLKTFDSPLAIHPNFIRIHQSYILNLKYMVKYTHRKEIFLRCEQSFNISRKFADRVDNAITRYLSDI